MSRRPCRAMERMRRLVLGLGAMAATVGCAATVPVRDDSRVAEVGRITDIDAQHGYAIVQFANGRMFVTMDKRELGHYIVGDELRVDSFGRPIP